MHDAQRGVSQFWFSGSFHQLNVRLLTSSPSLLFQDPAIVLDYCAYVELGEAEELSNDFQQTESTEESLRETPRSSRQLLKGSWQPNVTLSASLTILVVPVHQSDDAI